MKVKAKVGGKPQQFLGTIVHPYGSVRLFTDKTLAPHLVKALMEDVRVGVIMGSKSDWDTMQHARRSRPAYRDGGCYCGGN